MSVPAGLKSARILPKNRAVVRDAVDLRADCRSCDAAKQRPRRPSALRRGDTRSLYTHYPWGFSGKGPVFGRIAQRTNHAILWFSLMWAPPNPRKSPCRDCGRKKGAPRRPFVVHVLRPAHMIGACASRIFGSHEAAQFNASHLPPWKRYIVMPPSRMSPFLSKAILPVTPEKLSFCSAGRYFAGSAESAAFIASIRDIAAS
jgi:hypothetical protein